MKNFTLLGFTLCCLTFSLMGQKKDSIQFEGYYFGVQGNELLRQLLDLGNAELPDNPYFFNLDYNDASGDGFNIGLALRVDKFDQQNQFNTTTTEINDFLIRLGYHKKNQIGKRFYYSLGVDFLVDNLVNKTRTEDSFSSNVVSTETKTSGWGLGPRLTINYHITNRLIIGTESNYYYKSLKDKFNTTFESSPENNTEDELKIDRLNFVAPSVLWLIIKM